MTKSSQLPRLVIVGRPNVGKSTLFNRLLGRRRSLVHDEPGVTRDRIEEKASWWFYGKEFPLLLVDTGGVGGDRFSIEIEQQVQTALSLADAVIVLFDGPAGLTAMDEDLLRNLKQSGIHKKIPLIGVVNKIDALSHEDLVHEFHSSGLDPILDVSAEHGRGFDALRMTAAQALGFSIADARASGNELEDASETEVPSDLPEEPETRRIPHVAIVGKPNVGKSTLTNAVLGEDRMITSPIAGTTVDSVDSMAELDGRSCMLIDTAGIRRKNKTEEGVEVLSVVQTRKALERADLAILVLDGELGITEQDEKIGGLIEESGCSVILAINKWDTQEANRQFSKEQAAERIRKQMAFLRYAPIIFTSGKTSLGLDGLGELIEEILHQRSFKIPTHEFTEWVRAESEIHNPMNAKFYMSHQTSRRPPTFACHVSDPEKVHFSLKRHLVNALRERWGFMGTPVRLVFVQGSSPRPARRSTR